MAQCRGCSTFCSDGHDLCTECATKLAKGGVKFDKGKLRWGLVPIDAMREIVKVLTYGAVKYKERNWEMGMNWHQPYDALQRHLTAWWEGQDKDSETGYSHLGHAGCCLLFLIAYELRGIGKDDREGTWRKANAHNGRE